ncbi:MAG: hypothetical protein O3C43_00675 [Verrucomicrobia bacterium]|nr:hypothetical protein [Verrucomicrobiota bacterium]MDA1064991.1 hypothetical protein [Verrucomicrobiota bacterium]
MIVCISFLAAFKGTTQAAEIVAIAGPNGETNATVEVMSRDGTTLIGRTGNSFFRWTAEGGSVAMTDPGFSSILDISADGNTILATSNGGTGEEAYGKTVKVSPY